VRPAGETASVYVFLSLSTPQPHGVQHTEFLITRFEPIKVNMFLKKLWGCCCCLGTYTHSQAKVVGRGHSQRVKNGMKQNEKRWGLLD
jgi:hypothetical protein